MNKDKKKMIDITDDLKDLSVEETRKMAEEFDAKLNKAMKCGIDQYVKGYADGKKETATKIVEWLIYFCGNIITPPINEIAAEYGLDAYAIRKRMMREGVEKAMKEGGECPCINLDESEE